MPSKGSKAASRQAKLRQKKRRGKGAPQIHEAGPSKSAAEIEEATLEAVGEDGPAPRPVKPSAARTATSRLARQPLPADTASTYPYLGVELRQIGIITLLIFILLAVLSFVLGG